MQITWIILAVVVSLVLELWAGAVGLALPLLATTAFYLAVTFGWKRAFLPAATGGLVLDVTVGRSLPCMSLLVLPAVLALAHFWRREGNCRSVQIQMVPGALAGLLQAGILLTIESFAVEHLFWRLLVRNLWVSLQLTAGGMLFLPVVIWSLDSLHKALNFPRYQTIQQQRPEPHVS